MYLANDEWRVTSNQRMTDDRRSAECPRRPSVARAERGLNRDKVRPPALYSTLDSVSSRQYVHSKDFGALGG